MATEAPMSFMKLRRSTPFCSGRACCGNSCSKNSSNASLRESSSRLRQNSRPRRSPTRWRNSVKSRVLESLMSVVAHRTTRQFVHPVRLDELRAEDVLVLRHVSHVEDLFTRPDVLLGIAMAVQAPLHGQRRGLVDEIHPVDAAVAGRAPDAFVHVNAVVELHEIGESVNPAPADGAVVPEA